MTRQDFTRWCVATIFVFFLGLTVTEIVGAQSQDVTPPVLQGFSFSPTAIDTTTGAQSVTVTAHVTDDLSGFSFGCVFFSSPSGGQSNEGCFSSSNLTS